LVAAACASSPPDRVPEALRGCWIERRGAEAITMRWFPANNFSWRGERLSYRGNEQPAHDSFQIDATAGEKERFGWAVCPLDDSLPHGPPCQPLYFGRGPAPADDSEWMEINAAREQLRFDYVNGGQRLSLFNGVRDGCD
jgi:hypothetical protein